MILTALKNETRTLHDSLDACPRLRALFSSELTPARYVALLEDFRAIYEPLERILGDFFSTCAITGLDFQERRKLPLLDRDLGVLRGNKGVSVDVPFTIQTATAALGCLYVLEGATLGGQVIARAVRKRLGMSRDAGLAFFMSYQESVTEKWRGLCDVIAHGRWDEEQEAEMIDAAKKTFAIFIARLTDRRVN